MFAGITPQIFWLILLIAMVVIEALTVGLTTIWMAGGALLALVLAMLQEPVWLQIAVFFATTSLLLFLTRPLVVRYLRDSRGQAYQEDSLVGRAVRVVEDVNNHAGTGKVIVNDVEWTARAQNPEQTFVKDEMAKVAAVKGVKLILEKNVL